MEGTDDAGLTSGTDAHEESDLPDPTPERPIEAEDTWVRLFVASFFVDNLLAGAKLLTDWLSVSPEFIRKAVKHKPMIMQQCVWRLATLLNTLNPLVLKVEADLKKDVNLDADMRSTGRVLFFIISSNCI